VLGQGPHAVVQVEAGLLHEGVRVHHEHVVDVQGPRGVRVLGLGQHAQNRADGMPQRPYAVPVGDEDRHVARPGPRQPVGLRVVGRHHGRGRGVVVALAEQPVEHRQDVPGSVAGHREPHRGVAKADHRGRRGQTVTDDVADGQQQPAVG
jgi:hypothetical protein